MLFVQFSGAGTDYDDDDDDYETVVTVSNCSTLPMYVVTTAGK